MAGVPRRQRDNISPDKGLLKAWPASGPRRVWAASGIGMGFSSVSVVGDRVYTMGDKGSSSYIFALNRATGKHVWSAKVGKPGGSYEDALHADRPRRAGVRPRPVRRSGVRRGRQR
ncbi:MAG: hypothetical protein U0736_09655 [Gemmataceae bacterium]